MRKFWLERAIDVSGVSGTGIVAEGAQFSDGQCVIRWTPDVSSLAIFRSMEDLMFVHGHDGSTSIIFEERFAHAD